MQRAHADDCQVSMLVNILHRSNVIPHISLIAANITNNVTPWYYCVVSVIALPYKFMIYFFKVYAFNRFSFITYYLLNFETLTILNLDYTCIIMYIHVYACMYVVDYLSMPFTSNLVFLVCLQSVAECDNRWWWLN